jgi:hypothetical protein
MHKLLQMQQPGQHRAASPTHPRRNNRNDPELLLLGFAQRKRNVCCASSKFIAFLSDFVHRSRMQWVFKQVACFVLNINCLEEVHVT